MTLKLTSEESTEAATYEDAKLVGQLMNRSWQVAIKISFYECVLTSLGFETPLITLTYKIGSGPMS